MTNLQAAYFFLLPFAITATIEFTPWWIYVPFGFLAAMLWAGVTMKIIEEKKDGNEEV